MKVLSRYYLWFIFILGFTTTYTRAQFRFNEEIYIRANYHFGFVLPEYQHFIYIVNDNVQSLELSLSRQTTGKNYWHQLYNYPEYGVSLFYSTLGNDYVFGRETGFYPYFITHIISRKKFQLNNQIGIGLSYVSKKFDLEDNFQNVSVGSRVNLHFNFKMGFRYQLPGSIFFNSGIAFNHFSNANFQEPNLGINSLTFYGGLCYLAGKEINKTIQKINPHKPYNEFSMIYSIGGKHIGALQTDIYFTSSLSFEFKRRLFRVFYSGIGSDLFYDSGTSIEMQANGHNDSRTSDNFRTGLHLSEEFVYNRMSIIIQEGLYLFLVDRVNHKILYNRAIFRYKVVKRFSINISMKSHLHILDYPELGFGYHW
jgi:hypothetical protein